MTVTTTEAHAGPFYGDGANTSFPFDTFTAQNTSEVAVMVDGVEVSSALYSVTISSSGGGEVTFDTAPGDGSEVFVYLDVPFSQQTQFLDGFPYKGSAHNAALDRALLRDQMLRRDLDRALRLPLGQTGEITDWANGEFLVRDAEGNPTGSVGPGSDSDLRTDLAADGGGALVGYTDPAASAQATSVATALSLGNFVSALNWMTPAEREDVTSFTGALDVTDALQAAMDETWASNRNLYLPAGLYSVSLLVLPGNGANRNRGWKMFGQGHGELFARAFSNGTIIASDSGTPVIINDPDVVPGGVGTFEVAWLRIEQTNPAAVGAVVAIGSMYGPCDFHDCSIYQSGPGFGMSVDFAATGSIRRCYILGPNWTGAGAGSGYGLIVRNVHDAGLFRVEGVTCRGFNVGFQLGDTTPGVDGQVISLALRDCESSYNEYGFVIEQVVRKATLDNCYFEGGLGGFGVWNKGSETTIQNCKFFSGSAIGIKHDAAARGALYSGNAISLGNADSAAADPVGIEIASPTGRVAVVGGMIVQDPDSYGPVVNAVGIKISGADPLVDVIGVDFQPIGIWDAGDGAYQVDLSGVTGSLRGQVPVVSGGALRPEFRGTVKLSNTTAVADLNQDISASYVEAEVQAISDKVDDLLAMLRTGGVLPT